MTREGRGGVGRKGRKRYYSPPTLDASIMEEHRHLSSLGCVLFPHSPPTSLFVSCSLLVPRSVIAFPVLQLSIAS